MASVLIADDHAMFRTGVRHYLEQDRSIDTILETGTGAETLKLLREVRCDLVILDINMPDRSGIDILRHIRAGFPETRILVLSGFAEKQYAINVLRAGASGYLAKDQAPEELMRAVHTVLAGRRFVSAALSELLVGLLDEQTGQPLHAGLSQREFQIMCKLAVGRSVSEIAQELFISVKTVSTYRARVLQKMNLQTNADVTTYALRNGLVQ
ncbi:MAG: response regulator transcription factor [Gammaproteobacteria bacterium]|nr:response regulator transcription factor [Gammaproteobacteria bacterium]MBV8496775.1 response regulator transcription factor [Gammaproteobacteria bacterium]